MSPLLTTEDVAAILRVSTRTVRRMGQTGQLERIHVGGRLTRYAPASLDALLTPRNDDGAPRQAPRVTTVEATRDGHRTEL